MTKRKPKPEPAPKMVMGDCGHEIDAERHAKGYHWCMKPECARKYADVVIPRVDPETGTITFEDPGPQERAWFREEG
jgi:hypothetical protein